MGPSTRVQHQSSLPGSNSTQYAARSPGKPRLSSMRADKPPADDTVLLYTQRLDDHRKMCELTGRCVLQPMGSNSMCTFALLRLLRTIHPD